MNDFFLANNRSITIKVLGHDVEVKQLQMHNFDIWSPLASVIRDTLKQRDYSDLIGATLVKDYGAHVFQLCSLCTNIAIDVLLELAESDPLEFSHLLKHVINVNGAYFKEPKPRKQKKSSEEQSSWFDAFQFLIAHGHQHSEIMQMSYGCFINYLKAAQKVYLDDNKLHANVIRAAQHSDKKGFEKFQAELSKH